MGTTTQPARNRHTDPYGIDDILKDPHTFNKSKDTKRLNQALANKNYTYAVMEAFTNYYKQSPSEAVTILSSIDWESIFKRGDLDTFKNAYDTQSSMKRFSDALLAHNAKFSRAVYNYARKFQISEVDWRTLQQSGAIALDTQHYVAKQSARLWTRFLSWLSQTPLQSLANRLAGPKLLPSKKIEVGDAPAPILNLESKRSNSTVLKSDHAAVVEVKANEETDAQKKSHYSSIQAVLETVDKPANTTRSLPPTLTAKPSPRDQYGSVAYMVQQKKLAPDLFTDSQNSTPQQKATLAPNLFSDSQDSTPQQKSTLPTGLFSDTESPAAVPSVDVQYDTPGGTTTTITVTEDTDPRIKAMLGQMVQRQAEKAAMGQAQTPAPKTGAPSKDLSSLFSDSENEESTENTPRVEQLPDSPAPVTPGFGGAH